MITIDYSLRNIHYFHFLLYEIEILSDLIKYFDHHLTMKIIQYQQILLMDLFHKYKLDNYYFQFQLILYLIHNFHKKFFQVNVHFEKNLLWFLILNLFLVKEIFAY